MARKEGLKILYLFVESALPVSTELLKSEEVNNEKG